MRKKKPSLLTESDFNIFQQMEDALNVNEEECVSLACNRFGDMPDEDMLFPSQHALESFCKDNPKLNTELFQKWEEELISNESVFRLNRVMLDAIDEARTLFDAQVKNWIAEGLVDPAYDTRYAFWAMIGMLIYTIYGEIKPRQDQLTNDAFFKNPMFGKYKILALEESDNCTLDSFPNNKAYNRYDMEAILFYVFDRYEGYDRYNEFIEIYNQVKSIVWEDPSRLLSDTKVKLEGLAKSSSEKKFQYAFFYARAVIDYWLNKNR